MSVEEKEQFSEAVLASDWSHKSTLQITRLFLNPATFLVMHLGIAADAWLAASQITAGTLFKAPWQALVSYMTSALLPLATLLTLSLSRVELLRHCVMEVLTPNQRSLDKGNKHIKSSLNPTFTELL